MWVLELSTEKNKLAPSHYTMMTVFDKKYGIVPILSEYYFMANMSSWEKKITKNLDSKLCYPLCVKTVANSKVITVYDPTDPKIVLVATEKFTERNLLSKYNSDPKFKAIFELALKYSIQERVLKGYFREVVKIKAEDIVEVPEIIDTVIDVQEENLNNYQEQSLDDYDQQDETSNNYIEQELIPNQDFDENTGEIYEIDTENLNTSSNYYTPPGPDETPVL